MNRLANPDGGIFLEYSPTSNGTSLRLYQELMHEQLINHVHMEDDVQWKESVSENTEVDDLQVIRQRELEQSCEHSYKMMAGERAKTAQCSGAGLWDGDASQSLVHTLHKLLHLE